MVSWVCLLSLSLRFLGELLLLGELFKEGYFVLFYLAWFRVLPTGVLDSFSPEQVMQCQTEEECTELVSNLPHAKGALLDWAINLMADVVEQEHVNKMNACNIAMVFAPNMTQLDQGFRLQKLLLRV